MISQDAILFIAFGLHSAGEFLDAYSTNIALTCGKNIFTEGNPISAWLIKKIGLGATAAIKMGVVPIAITVTGILASSYEKEAIIANLTLAAITGTIGILNLIKIKKAGISINLF